MIPALIIQGEQLYTLLTAMFVHGDIFHILSNMLYLYIFGNNVEDSMGSGRFVIFYLLCGVLASFAHILIDPTSKIPTLGASGAVSGVLGAYLVMYPRERVDALIGYFLIRVRAVVVLLSWFALQLLYGILSLGQTGQGGVAFFAHIGGFIAGALLIFIFRKRQKAQW
jgi:membrane associated rhomboid family serine protease